MVVAAYKNVDYGLNERSHVYEVLWYASNFYYRNEEHHHWPHSIILGKCFLAP